MQGTQEVMQESIENLIPHHKIHVTNYLLHQPEIKAIATIDDTNFEWINVDEKHESVN